MFSRRGQTAQVCASTGVANSASITATLVAGDGISLLMAQNARHLQLLMLQSICIKDLAAEKIICTAHVTLKVSVIKSTKARCAWDSGLATAQGMEMLMRTQAGTQCPGFMWKKCLPRKLKIKGVDSNVREFWKIQGA